MLPNDTTGEPPTVADIVYHPFRIRSDSESQQISGAGINANSRRQSISEGLRASRDGGESRRSRHASGSRGSVLADLFRFRYKSTSPQALAAAAKTEPEPETEQPDPPNAVLPSSNHHTRQRSNSHSTVDRPQQLLYFTDPSVNRPQVSPGAVESSRAKMLRQRRGLAPQWVKVSNPQDQSPPSAIYGDTNGGQSLLTISQTTTLGAVNPVIMSRKDEAPKRSVFDSNWNQNPAYKHTGRRLSLFPTPSLPLNPADPEFGSSSGSASDAHPRSGSRGIVDFFRTRKKSTTQSPSMVITPPSESKDSSQSKFQMKSPQKTTRRQRSKSTVEPPVLSPEQRYQWKETEPIAVRVFNAKRDLPPDTRLSLPCSPCQTEPHATPMSELLSVPGSSKLQAFGIKDFLQLYNSQNNNNNSYSKRDSSGRRSPTRTSFAMADEFSSTGLEDDSTTSSSSSGFLPTTRIISGQTLQLDLPESIPEYLEVHQVSSTSSLQPTRTRRISPANNQFILDSELSREQMDRQSGLNSINNSDRRRRYSEPPKPNLRQMAVLNSIHMKLVNERDNGGGGSEHGLDYNKALSNPTAIAQSLGIKIPMTSRHQLLLWRNEETGAQLLKLPASGKGHQDDLYDIDSKDKLTFVKLMKLHKCHELMPQSAKLVLLDSELEVISAFFALMFNEIRAAPIWDSSERDFVGMLTVTDFINVLQMHYNSPDEVGNLEEHKISKWIDLLHGPRKSTITVDPDDRLFDAVVQLSTNRIHRILVADSVNGDALYVLSYRRILRFIYLLTYEVHLPNYMEQSIWDLQIGTYGDKLFTVTPTTRLIDALNLLVQKRISAVPVVNDNGQPINIYAKVDVINLAANESYKSLDTTVEETLKLEREKFEGVFLCKKTDSLHQVMKWFIQENIHRLLVVDDDMLLVGIVSLSDIVHFLVIRQSEESGGDFQPGDIDLEIDISLQL